MRTNKTNGQTDPTPRRAPVGSGTSSPHSLEAFPLSLNEAKVPLEYEDLAPHVVVLRVARPSLTYDRIE